MSPFRATILLLLSAAMGASACPSDSQCQKSADCGSTTPGGCDTCPAQASQYCAGGVCEAAPSASLDLRMNITARNQSILSLRYAVVAFDASTELPECAGRPGCTADVALCDELKEKDWSDARFNVFLSGAKNASTAGGADVFTDISVGMVPSSQHNLVVEGRSGTLGNGDRVSFACMPISSSPISLTLNRL